jgi:DNA replication initiation complex subunit (GINS family)
MITYNDIYEALRRERYSEQLQPLPKNFISDVSDYFNDKKKIASKEDDVFSDSVMKTKKQFENAVGIFRDLLRKRKQKILKLSFIAGETGISKRDFENMFGFEREMFEKIMESMEYAEKKLNSLMNGEREKEKKTKLVMILKDVGEFIDLEGNALGPFNEGEIVNLPSEIAKILVEDNKAEEVDED